MNRYTRAEAYASMNTWYLKNEYFEYNPFEISICIREDATNFIRES